MLEVCLEEGLLICPQIHTRVVCQVRGHHGDIRLLIIIRQDIIHPCKELHPTIGTSLHNTQGGLGSHLHSLRQTTPLFHISSPFRLHIQTSGDKTTGEEALMGVVVLLPVERESKDRNFTTEKEDLLVGVEVVVEDKREGAIYQLRNTSEKTCYKTLGLNWKRSKKVLQQLRKRGAGTLQKY